MNHRIITDGKRFRVETYYEELWKLEHKDRRIDESGIFSGCLHPRNRIRIPLDVCLVHPQ